MHVMLDLETTGLKPGCAISEIAAVVFDPSRGPKDAANSPYFYRRFVSVRSCHALGLTDDADTMAWRKKHIPAPPADAEFLPLALALDGFSYWLRLMREECAHKDFSMVWAKGANFDFPILEAAYDAVGLPFPFKYWQCTCIRGVLALAGVKADSSHSAVEDCRYQAFSLVQAMDILRARKAVAA